MPDPHDPSAMLGRQLGKYIIEEPLGIGGMGQVFRARHVELQRLVALKLMHAQMAHDSSFQARFRREARSAAALRHPHIVEVFDFDEQDGYAYLVMELITGGTLRNLLKEGSTLDPSWSLLRGLDLVRQGTDALAYAHALGMVHRDIKPENMLLQPSPTGSGFILKLGDFGLARIEGAANASIATQAGMAVGTLAYMSPEQAGGRTVDARTDIYALGVILFELATGQLPFAVKTITEAIFKHSFVAPPQPRSIRPDLPEALETAILRCLAKTPEERYASAADLAAALRELTGSTPDLAAASIAALLAGTTQVGTVMGYAAGGHGPEGTSLAGASSLPRIQVLDEGGMLLQVVAVRPGGVSVGRLSANDLHLDAPSVSRHHLQVLWDGMRVTVTDLGSKSGTELNGIRLTPQAGVEWPWGGMLHISPYWLRLEAPIGRTHEHQIGTGERGALGKLASNMSGSQGAFGTAGRIAIVLDPESLTLVPGRSSTVETLLTNLRGEADQATLSVSGVPEEWVTLPPPIQLAASGQASARMTISVPDNSDARAGEYSVGVRARSRLEPSESTTVLARWSVHAVTKAALSIVPARLAGRGRATYRVTLRNEGNASVAYRLAASDNVGELDLALDHEQVTIDPGEAATIGLQVGRTRRLIGADASSQIEVRAQAGDGHRVANATAHYVDRAVLPTWALLAFGLFALLGFGGVALSGGQFGGSNTATPLVTLAPGADPTATSEVVVVMESPEAPTGSATALVNDPTNQPTIGTITIGPSPSRAVPSPGEQPTDPRLAPTSTAVVPLEQQAQQTQAAQVQQTQTAQAQQDQQTRTAQAQQAATAAAATQTAVITQGIAQQTSLAITQTAEAKDVSTPSPTATPTPTVTITPSPTATSSPTHTPTNTPILPNLLLTYDPPVYQFGDVPVSTVVTSSAITVRNDSNVRVRIAGHNATVFSLQAAQTTCVRRVSDAFVYDVELDPGATCTVFMKILKNSPGQVNGILTLTIESGILGWPSASFDLALSATALEPTPVIN